MRITAKQRRDLNHIEHLISLNNRNPWDYQTYLRWYNALHDAVMEMGFMIMATQPIRNGQNERRTCPLHVLGTEDKEVENCLFVVDIYHFQTGKIEFNGYFS